MKKLSISAVLIMLAFSSLAQVKIGLVVAPGFSSNRVKFQEDTIGNDGSEFRTKFGLEFDFQASDNYAFSTGLIFAPKRVGISVDGPNESFKEEYKVQYLQIPATLKLFTNEVQPDLKVYFQLGFMGEILLYTEALDNNSPLIEDFRFYDFSFTGGAGVEYGAGVNTIIYGGIFYDHGLANIVSDQAPSVNGDLTVRTRFTSLKVGLKF